MINLVIGNTSQLAYYFPDDYEKISSRDINYEYYQDKKIDTVYLCFAEQRTFLEDKNLEDKFIKVNVDYTLDVIEKFKPISKRIVVYSTCELWNNCTGGIDLKTYQDYNYSPYIRSKGIMSDMLFINHPDVIILYPFNFNSVHRKSGFLFSKIFNSIINKKKIEIGDTYFYRDIIHPKYLVERSIKAKNNELVGSGRLTFINDFIRDLYSSFNMNYDDYVTENFDHNLKVERKIFYLNSQKNLYTYKNLLDDTVEDISRVILINHLS